MIFIGIGVFYSKALTKTSFLLELAPNDNLHNHILNSGASPIASGRGHGSKTTVAYIHSF